MADCICSALAVGGPGKPLLHRAGCPTSSLPAKPSSCHWLVTPSPGLPFSSPSEPQRDWVQREGSRLLEAGCTLQASRWAHLPLHQAWFFSHTPQASDRQPPCGLRCCQILPFLPLQHCRGPLLPQLLRPGCDSRPAIQLRDTLSLNSSVYQAPLPEGSSSRDCAPGPGSDQEARPVPY